jgi:hypothetical protein
MLNLESLITRLVEDVLRAIGEATLDELADARPTQPATANRARSTRRSRQREAPRRGASRASQSASPADAHALPDSALEAPGFDAITNPEDLLAPTGRSAVAEPEIVPTVRAANEGSTAAEEVVPPSRVQPIDRPTPMLRAGESLVRATAAGIVIRRARSR